MIPARIAPASSAAALSSRAPSRASSAIVSLVAASLLGASLTTTTTARADEPPKARVVIEGTKPDVEVSLQTGSAFGAGSNGSTIAITSWKNVCVAPCAFDLPQGRQTLLFRREGSPSTTHSAIFRPGETRLTVKPGLVIPYTIGYTLVFLGLTAALAGGSLWAAGALSPSGDGGKKSGIASTGKYLTLGGAVGMAGGIALVLTTGTDVEEKAPDAPRAFRPQPPTAASRALGLSYGRAF